MNTVAHSMLDSISDIEKVYPTSDDCSSWGGKRFFDELLSSSKELVQNATNAKSSVTLMKHSASNMHIFHAKNVSLTLTSQGSFHSAHDKAHNRGQWLKNAQPKLTLGVDGRISLPDIKGGSMLENLNSVAMNNGDCDVHIEYPVMLVDSGLDSWNWWFFLQSILHHYIVVAALQPEIMGDYQRDALRVLFTSHDVMYSRSNLDAFDFLFSDRRGRDSTQLWSLESDKKLCFRQLIFSPSFTGGGHMLVNRIHKHDSCFSSVVYSYAAYLKAALHIPTLPRPSKPRVVWVGRDTSSAANWNSWQRQRIINNQPQLIEFLRKKCSELGIELMVADFYGDKKETPFQEQALFISKANIMIGMHGAGLNMFHFMPFNSVVIEIHKGTTGNKNSKNYVQHIKEGAYLTTSVNPGDKGLDENKIWELLKEGIDKWESLGTQSFPITTSKLRRST